MRFDHLYLVLCVALPAGPPARHLYKPDFKVTIIIQRQITRKQYNIEL